MFTMRDYLVEAQRRHDEIAGAQHHNLVKSVSRRSSPQIGRLLVHLGQGLVRVGRSLQGCPVESGQGGPYAGRAGIGVA